MHFFYTVAVLVMLFGLLMWAKFRKDILWWECLTSSVVALLLAGMFHLIAFNSRCSDQETFSGRVVSATFHPWWQDEVRVEDYRDETYTTGSGKDSQTHTRRVHVGHHYEYNNHPEHWDCVASYGPYLGEETYSITRDFFNDISRNFCDGKPDVEQPYKSDFYKGDRNIYVARNRKDYWYPTTTPKSFDNRLLAGPSLYMFAPVPKGSKVFAYPPNDDPFKSGRLLGTASKTISRREWDILNGKLGPRKKVNLIMVGFGDVPPEAALWQQSSWVGGKKNDLVMCYGGPDPLRPTWSRVFGWTDSELVKANLQSVLLGNPVDNTILPMVEREVAKNYVIKRWKDFDYLEVEPPGWSYWVYVLVVLVVQAGLWWAMVTRIANPGLTRGYGMGYNDVFRGLPKWR